MCVFARARARVCVCACELVRARETNFNIYNFNIYIWTGSGWPQIKLKKTLKKINLDFIRFGLEECAPNHHRDHLRRFRQGLFFFMPRFCFFKYKHIQRGGGEERESARAHERVRERET